MLRFSRKDTPMSNLKITAPQAIPEPGWTTIKTFPTHGEGRPFLSGDTEGNRVRVAYFLRKVDGVVCARAWFGWAAQGPPGHAHGGSIATVLDETMGVAVLHSGYLAVLASLTVQYREKVPLGTDTVVEAEVCRTERRKIYTRAVMRCHEDGRLFAEAEGLYVMQNLEQLCEMKDLPASLQKPAET